MKVAIISITSSGQLIAKKLADNLKNDPTVLKVDLFHKNVKKTLNNISNDYNCILGIMAAGIMVRSVCNLIRSKTEDPAVLVMDEKSEHVISLLSGHYGGANEWACKIARITGADPVITTATDLNGKMGVDTIAYKYHFDINSPSKILNINQALVDGKKVILSLPQRFQYLFENKSIEKSYHRASSHRIEVKINNCCLALSPKKMVVGVGARKGISSDSVLSALNQACNDLGIPMDRIDVMATVEFKKNEKGILEAADELDLPLEIVPLDKLKNFKHPEITESSFVRRRFEVPGICEPAALIVAGGNSKLIYRKKAWGKVTVALAVSDGSKQ